jgi:hypothetical protein
VEGNHASSEELVRVFQWSSLASCGLGPGHRARVGPPGLPLRQIQCRCSPGPLPWSAPFSKRPSINDFFPSCTFFHTANNVFLISWWNDAKTTFPSLHLYALDTLAIPAMSARWKTVFSRTKKLITPERKRLAEDVIEASECLKNWWGRGLIQQLEDDEEI